MATQEDILAPICETTKQGGEAKDQAANILLNKLPNKEKPQIDQLHELPQTLESNFDLMHVKDNKNSEQTFEGEQILASPSITEASCDAYTVPPEEFLEGNCKRADPPVLHTEKTEEITADAVEKKQEGLECVSKVVSNEEARQSHAVKAPLNNDTDATSAVIYEPKIENEDLTKPGLTGVIQCTGNTLLGLEAEAEKYVDTKATTSSQSKEPGISLEERNVIADPQKILDEKIVDVVNVETLENVAANVCNEEPENISPIQVDEHYQKKSENPSLLENAECALLEEKPSESTHVASEDIKAFALSQTNETNDYFEDQTLNANPREILDDKREVKPIGEASIKKRTLQIQSLTTIASNEDIKESEKEPLCEHSTGLTHADFSETSREVKIADEKIREDEQFYSEKNLESPLLKKDAQQEKPMEYLQEANGGQDVDAACSFKDESLTENPQETSSGKAEERTANVIDKKEETLDIQNASISDEKESLIGVDDSEKKSEELLVDAKIENAESKKPELHESPLLKVESQAEKCVESIQIALENTLASDSTESIDTTSWVEEKGLIADSQGIMYDKIEDKTTDAVDTEQSVEAHDTAVLLNEESKEKLLIQVDGSQLKNEEHFEMEAEKPCLLEKSTRDIDSNKHNLEIGDEDQNKVELLVNEGNTECNLVKEEAVEEKLVESFHIAKEEYKVSSQDKEVVKEDGHENPEECLQLAPQDDKVLIQKTEEARNIVEEKILSQCRESDEKKAEVMKIVESLHVAHEDDKPSLDMEVEKEQEEYMVADLLNTAKDDIGLSQDTEVANEVAAEENLVETLHVAYVADKALSPDLEEVNKVAYEENFLLVDPEKNKSSSQEDLAKKENTAETSYVALKGEKLEAGHENLVESSNVVLKHDKAFMHNTGVTKKEVDVEHVAESLNEALPDKAPSQDTEATKKETEQKKKQNLSAPPENDAMSSQEEKTNDEEKLEEILYVASEAHKSLCPEAGVGKREATAETPTESLNVVFEGDGNQKTEVAEEEMAVDPLHVTHEDAKVLSQEAEVSITEIDEAKHVEFLKPVEFLNIVFEGDGNQRSKVAEKEKSVESFRAAHEDAKALSQEAEVSVTQMEEAKPVEPLKSTKSLNVVFEDDGNQKSKVAEEEISVESLLVAHEDAKASSQEAEVSITELEEAKPVECLKSTEFLNVVSEDDGNQRSKVAEVSVTQIEEPRSVESLNILHKDDDEVCQDTNISKVKVKEDKSVAPFCVNAELNQNYSTKEDHNNTLESDEVTIGQGKESNEVMEDPDKAVNDKDIEFHMSDNQQRLTAYSEPLRQDTDVAIEEIEEVKLGESLHIPFEDNKELCLDNQVAKEGVLDELVESLRHDKKISTDISTKEPYSSTVESHEGADYQSKETSDEVQKDHGSIVEDKDIDLEMEDNLHVMPNAEPLSQEVAEIETVIDDKNIASQMTGILPSQDREVVMEDIKIEETKDVESLDETSQNVKEQCPHNQAAKEEATKDQHLESLLLVAHVDEKVNEDTKVPKEEGEKSIEPLCVAEDEKEISADISIKNPHSSRLGLSEAVEDQIKETKDEVKKDPEIIVKDKDSDLPIKDRLQDVPNSETLSQDREVAMEKVEEVKPIESLRVPCEDDKTLCLNNQVAGDEKEAENKLVESYHVTPTEKRTSNQEIEVAKQEGEKSTKSSCVAPEDDKEISTDISEKEAHSNIFDSDEVAEDQHKEIGEEEQNDPESAVKSKDIDLKMTDKLDNITRCSEPSSQNLEAAIEEVEELKPVASLHVPSEDDKQMCLDNQVAKEEIDDKLVESFLVAPEDKNASNEDASVAKGEKFVEPSCVALDDDKELSTDISIEEPQRTTLESHEAAEEQSKETNDEVKDCEIIVKDKDIDLKMTDNLQNATSYSESLSQNRVLTMEEEEVKPLESLHVPHEDDKTSCLEIQAAAKYAEDNIVESFHVAPEDKRTSNKDNEVSNEGEKDDKETSTDISTREPLDNTLGSYDATEYQIKETNDKKDLETVVARKDINLQMKDNLQHVTPYSEPLSQEQEVAMEEIDEMKLVESVHIPSEDDKEICLENQVMKEEGENKFLESFYVAPMEQKASNQDSVAKEKEKFVESSCVALDDKEIMVDIPHNKLGSCEAPEDQSKETHDEVQKDPETIVRNKDIEFHLTDHVTSQDRDILTDEVEKVMLVESLHAPRGDDKEVCTNNQITKEQEAENKLVEPFHVDFDGKTSIQDTGVAIERENVAESSCVALEDDKEISTDTTIKYPHSGKLSSDEAAEDQIKETNDEVEKDPKTTVMDKDIKLLRKDNSQNVTPNADSLGQEQEVATEEVEKVMAVESLHLPSNEDKELCPENVAKEEQEEDKLGQSFDLALDDEKESNPDSIAANKAGEESDESSCVAVEDGKEKSHDISTIGPHNKIFVSPEEAKEQSKEANEEVEDNYGSMVMDKDIELQLRDDQHVIPSPEELSQDTEVLTEEIGSKPRECLTELSEDGKESSLDKGEMKLAGSFYVAPEDDKASRQEMKEMSEQGEEEKPTEMSHVAPEDCRTLNQKINDEVQEDPETTAKDMNIDLQMTDNRSITPYSETDTDDEAHAFKEIKEFEGKSPDGNIEKDFNEEKIEEKPAINIAVQEETCQKFDVTDNSTQVVSTYSDEKNNFLVPCIEDEKKSTELDVEVPEKIGSGDGNVKTTKMSEEKGYLQDLQTITAVNIATHEEKAIELEDVTRPETETSYVSHEQVGLSVVEVSEEQPHMNHEKIEEPHVSHAKGADVANIVPDIPKDKADHTSTGKISCNEEAESEEMELFGDELSRIAANKSLEEVDSKNEERELEVTAKPGEEEDQTETVKVINASMEEEERSQDFSKQIMDNPESIPVDLKANEQGGELEVTTKPVEEEEQTETVKVIDASLEEEERSQDFSKQIMDNPESIPVDLKANEQEGEKIACIQEIGAVSETKVDDNKFKPEEMAKEFLQKAFSEPAEFEDHLTAEKDLTADGDIEKEAASEKEADEQKILCGISNTPSMIEGTRMDLATSANEAVDENTNYKVAGHEKTSHEITGIIETMVTANETSLRGYLIDDNSKCEIESSDKVPETTKMTTSTESQAIESLRVEEGLAFEFLPARAESEEANIGCLATPKFKKIADESIRESCVGENEARLGLEEEIPKEEENAKKENVENISEKEVVPTPLEGVPESSTQVQDCDVISKSEEIEIKEEISGVAKMGIKSEGVVLEEAFEPKETTCEAKETGEANMSTEKIKDEDEDSKDDFTGSYKEEIIREIQTENKVDQDVEVFAVIETAKGNEEVSKVFEDPNDTQNISTHVSCNDKSVEELGENLQSNESIDVSLNQTAQGKSIKEVSALLDTEEVVYDLESSRSECERSIEKAERSAIEFEDKRSTADDLDNEMITELKMSAADAAKAELPGKPDICTVSEPATKPPYETLEHYEDNNEYLKPIIKPQPEDSESKQLVPEFSQEKGSEKWDDKNEISSSDKVELEEDTLMLSSEKTDEMTSITDNWSIITGNNNGKPCIEAEKFDLSTDKQVSPQADHIEKIFAPEKKRSTESSLVKGGDSETSEVEKEEPNCGNEEQQIKEVTKSMEEPETEDVHKPSLEDIHQVSTKAIDPIADCSAGEEPTMSKEELYEEKSNETKHDESKAGEEHDEEEELCGQHKSDSSSEAPVMVDVGDADVKHTHKKSHNILSGVGSKVKHSIAKVKKAIIGKPSHPKPPSPK